MDTINYNGRVAIVSGEGLCIGDAKRPIAVEEIRDNFKEISDMTQTKEQEEWYL